MNQNNVKEKGKCQCSTYNEYGQIGHIDNPFVPALIGRHQPAVVLLFQQTDVLKSVKVCQHAICILLLFKGWLSGCRLFGNQPLGGCQELLAVIVAITSTGQ